MGITAAQNPVASMWLREGAPEADRVAQVLDPLPGQDGGTGRGEPRSRLEERVHEGRERSREEVGQGAQGAGHEPGEPGEVQLSDR